MVNSKNKVLTQNQKANIIALFRQKLVIDKQYEDKMKEMYK